MTSTHESRLSELQQRVAAIDAEVALLDDRYSSVANDFESGNQQALKRAEQIEEKITALRREKALALAAQVRIAEQQKQEQAAVEQRERQQREAEAGKLANAICSLHNDIDRALAHVRELFEQRHSLLHQLGNTGVVDAGVINRLATKSGPTRAFCAAQLHRFAEMQTPATNSMLPLGSANSILNGIGRAAAPAENTTVTSGSSAGGVPERVVPARRSLDKRAANGGDTT
jgi:hypothetical protein